MNKFRQVFIILLLAVAGCWLFKKSSTLDFSKKKIEEGYLLPGLEDSKTRGISAEKENRGPGLGARKAVAVTQKEVPLQGEIKIALAKLKEADDGKLLVSSGIPFAPGQLKSIRDFALLDHEGKEIPLAVKELARWPQDQSIRSVLVQFKYPIEHTFEYITFKWGVPRISEDDKVIEPVWQYPQGMVMMPKEWLCDSQVIGEQLPMGQMIEVKYDSNIEKYSPIVLEQKESRNLREGGYYSTPHVYYQFFVRSGELDYFLTARKELLHYRDSQIIQDGEERGRYVNDKEGRYVYVEALMDDYLLTGDPKSLEVAGYMAEYLKKYIAPSKAFYPKNAEHFFTERLVAFPFLGILTYYELTQDPAYLKIADEYMQNLYKTQLEWPSRGGFIHNLYAHDPEEGARKDEYGGSPFMAGLLLEPIVKYHQLTGSDMAADSIFRACDWLINEGLTDSGNAFKYLTADAYLDSDGDPDINLLVVHGLAYAYRLSGYSDARYLKAAQKVFQRGVKDAYLEKQKHFNQNYRSSGHYLAYIYDGLKMKMAKDSSEEHHHEHPQNAAAKNILYFEGFDYAQGRFKNEEDTVLKVDDKNVYLNGNSLKVKSKYDSSNLKAYLDLDPWDMEDFAVVSFSYFVPPGTPVGLSVKTQFGDWICLGGTANYQCPHSKVKDNLTLKDDGEWHEVDLNVRALVQSVLPGVNRLSAFQFFTAGNAKLKDQFWIDDFKVRK